jgi:hypothetical protein
MKLSCTNWLEMITAGELIVDKLSLPKQKKTSMKFATQAGTRLLFMDAGEISENDNIKKLIQRPESDRLKSFLRHVAEV